MTIRCAAKILVTYQDLIEKLGLPGGTSIVRLELEQEGYEQVLAIVVKGGNILVLRGIFSE